jgi:hypothetical protein
MGLDLTLGALVLLWAIRGWFKGLVVQAIGLAGLVGAVYGALLGALKGLVAAAFVTAGIERFLPVEAQKSEVVEEQTKNSRALAWSMEYHPAEKIWQAPPVQFLVGEVRRYGLDGAVDEAKPAAEAEPVAEPSATVKSPQSPADGTAHETRDPVKTARRSPQLTVPRVPRDSSPSERQALDEIDQELRELGLRVPDSR